MDNMNSTGKRGIGRPSKGPKVSVNLRLRAQVLRRFKQHIGPHQIFCEAVEYALVREMKRASAAA